MRISLIRGAGVVLLCALLQGCVERRVIEEVWSPDRKTKAVVYTVLGGVTADLITNVSVLEAPWGEPRLRPNALTVAHGAEDSPEGPYFGPKVSVRWLDEKTLEIAHDPRAQIRRKAEQVEDVRILYRQVPQQGLPRILLPEPPTFPPLP